MLVAGDLAALEAGRAQLRARGARLALVPTMGALHEGHLSIVEAARRDADAVAVSIFVNPLQFEDPADLARYPVSAERDLAMLERAGCALVWMPAVGDVFPPGHRTTIDVGALGAILEGAARPGHFRGVATVVSILLHRLRPDLAWFGEKDWQQLQVVRALVRDLALPVEIRGAPVRREPDGLPMSSRNRFLTGPERERAAMLTRTMDAGAARIRAGDAFDAVRPAALAALAGLGFETDYFELLDGDTLGPCRDLDTARLLVAARLGSVRLLDNRGLR